ncbi:MAG: FeS cluster assembly protein SufD [Chlamydiae bacterium]|nr:FeS cluster assembly protein SufD [Chlamydiota bacterium]
MKEQFISELERHFTSNLDGISPLQKAIREKAWEQFLAKGLPNKKFAGYQYFPFSHFYQESYELASLPSIPEEQIQSLIHHECRRSYVIFVNGQYVPELSNVSGLPEEVVVLRLRDALADYGNFLQMRLARAMKEEADPFAILNTALIQMGLFLYIPPKIVIDTPIQCLHIISDDHAVLFNPRIHFFLGKQAKVKWIYDHHCLKDFEYFSNGVIDIALEEGAHFEQYGILNPCHNGWCFEATRATLKRDSTFKSITYTTGTKSVRQDFRISLLGENTFCDLKGLAMLSENRQAHVNVTMDHAAERSTSNQLFKNVLADAARASFEGKIHVHSKAQKTQAYQLNNNLLLSDRAVANCKPNLEIFADDVKASHGATTAQQNPEHIFYLKTRGVDPKLAKLLLLSGFCMDILKEISFLPVRERMQQLVEKFLK